MAYRDLRSFLAALERQGELARVREAVSQDLEITAINDRVVKQGGPALLFEAVTGSTVPVLINAFGTRKRMQLALEVASYEEIAERIRFFVQPKEPQGLLEKLKLLPRLKEVADFFPRVVGEGPCQEVVHIADASFAALPILKCWPHDGGRYITLGLTFTKDPETGKRNCGVYRVQVFDDRTGAMHWQRHKHGAHHFRKSEGRRQRLEVAIVIGPDPAVTFAGIAPLPDDVDEMILASFLRREPVELVRARTVDVEVPANAEWVLEGYLDPGERRREGPFGDHTGWYSLADDYPVFHLTAVTHRLDPIYQTTVVGKPVQEDCFMGEAVGRIFLPLIRTQLPEIVDLHLPFAGVFHNLVIVSIRKRYPGHARKVMHALWGLGQLMFSKVIVVLDDDVDVHDLEQVAWKALGSIDPKRDTEFVQGPVDVLDHAAPRDSFGSKMGIDATRKWPEEGFDREWPEEIAMDRETLVRVAERWSRYGIPGVK